MIINILTEHEKTMDDLVEKLEKFVPDGRSVHLSTKISKWGNSRGVIIFKQVLDQANLDIGDPVDIIIRKRAHTMR
jgi:hypothetical protein